MASVAATFKAGTLLVLGGTTAVPAQDVSYSPVPGGSDDWNLKFQVGGTFVVHATPGSNGDFAASDVARVDTSGAGTTTLDSIAWPASATRSPT